MRNLKLAICSLFFAAAAHATTPYSVPNTFVAGSPAKAADVNGNFTALVNAVNALSGRIDKIDGTVALTAADIVGVYDLSQFRVNINSILTTPNNFPQVAEFVAVTGVITFNADGTGAVSLNDKSMLYGCPYLNTAATTLAGQTCPYTTLTSGPTTYAYTGTFNWTFANGQISSGLSQTPLIMVPGARMAIGVDQVPTGFLANGTVDNVSAVGTMFTIAKKR